MASNTESNIWAQMNYAPPRGQCNYKQSLVSPRCPCLRFMLHPLKSFTTFECDGCAHHASFHSLENKAEDEIRKRWEMEQRQKEAEARESKVAARPKKRARQTERVEPVGRVNRLMIEGAAEYTQGGAEGDTMGSDVASTSTIEFAPVYMRGRKTKTLTSGGAGSLQRTSRHGRAKANEAYGRSSVVDDQDLILVD